MCLWEWVAKWVEYGNDKIKKKLRKTMTARNSICKGIYGNGIV